MTYNLFCLYLSFTKELFSLHLGHHTARLVMTQKMLSEKVYRKKKVSPPSSTKAHPLRDIQAELSQFLITIYKQTYLKYTIYRIFEAYLNILFCSWTTEKYFSYAKKKLAYTQLKIESYLIIQKLPSEEIPSGSLSHFLCSEVSIVVLSYY